MEAKEANQVAIESCRDEIEEIKKAIDQVANDGGTDLMVEFPLKGGTESYLIKQGYEVIREYRDIPQGRTILKSIIIKWLLIK